MEDNEKTQIIHKFASDLIENMHDIPEEFAKVLDDNFWDLLA